MYWDGPLIILVIKQETSFKYGKLTAKKAEAIPWDRLLVDLIGP